MISLPNWEVVLCNIKDNLFNDVISSTNYLILEHMPNGRSVEDIFKELLKSQCYCCTINCSFDLNQGTQVYIVVTSDTERAYIQWTEHLSIIFPLVLFQSCKEQK